MWTEAAEKDGSASAQELLVQEDDAPTPAPAPAEDEEGTEAAAAGSGTSSPSVLIVGGPCDCAVVESPHEHPAQPLNGDRNGEREKRASGLVKMYLFLWLCLIPAHTIDPRLCRVGSDL